MTTRNTGSFIQSPRSYSIQLATANTNYTTPTTPGLLWIAGPDGSDISEIAVTPTATVTSANQMQFFASPDGGTTFNLLPFGAVMATYTMAQTTALPITYIPMPNNQPMGTSNPFVLTGVTNYPTFAMVQSTLTDLATVFYGGKSFGTANAQTLPFCYNTAGTILGASPATGSIVDFECGITNTTTATIAPGSQIATAIKRSSGTNLSAGDLTVGFRYRMVWDGTEWILLLTQRLYFAMGQAQGVCATAWGYDR